MEPTTSHGERDAVIDYPKVSLFKPSGRKFWQLKWIDPHTGRERRESTKQRLKSRAEVVRKAKEIELATKGGTDQNLSWKQFKERVESEYLPDLKDSTQVSFWVAINHYEKEMNPKKLTDLNASNISKFQAKLRQRKKNEQTGEKLSDATVGFYLRTIQSALSWAVSVDLLVEIPTIKTPRGAKGKRSGMRGRPITEAEFQQILDAVPEVRAGDAVDWEFYLRALWLSGLRLEESFIASWDSGPFQLNTTGENPFWRIEAEGQKKRQDQSAPITPDFRDFILTVPNEQRSGKLFEVCNRFQKEWIKTVVRKIGHKANVLVDPKRESFASAQTYRQSFGSRWARKVKPFVLKALMRHSRIETTEQYYIGIDIDELAAELEQC